MLLGESAGATEQGFEEVAGGHAVSEEREVVEQAVQGGVYPPRNQDYGEQDVRGRKVR
jgi:hypothetical protein